MSNKATGTFIHSLALQAVLDQMTKSIDKRETKDATDGDTPPALFASSASISRENNHMFIREVIEASRSLLSMVVRELGPGNASRHVPVRTQHRIMAAAMFLLKVSYYSSPVFHDVRLTNRGCRPLLLVGGSRRL